MSAKSRVPLSFNPKNPTDNAGADRRPAWNKLRVDRGDGSLGEDYRIENGQVEMRVLDFSLDRDGHHEWRRLTREQLIAHVMGNTAVARWLQRRMGVHPLIRACAPPSSPVKGDAEPSPESRAA